MISIVLDQPDLIFLPGDPIQGTITWSSIDQRAKSFEVQLLWSTIGRGTRDEEVVATHSLELPSSEGTWDFKFIAPHRPYSFAGTLISLQWEIRVLQKPGKNSTSTSLEIGPQRKAIRLPPIDSTIEDFGSRLKKIFGRT